MIFNRLGEVVRSLVVGGAIALALSEPSPAAVDFVKDVQPILEMNCVACHSGDNAEGGFDLAERPGIRKWIARCESSLHIH